MAIKVYNTLTDKKEEMRAGTRSFFGLFGKKKIKMFVCGPTVYDFIHIGNARTFVIFDFITKYLEHLGYDVFYLQNITDIDDRIIKRAKDDKVKPIEIAEKFEKQYMNDVEKMKIDAVDKYARASEHIDEIITQVQTLEKKGYAYTARSVMTDDPEAVNDLNNKDVYFDVSKFNDYGKLSKQKLEAQESGTRVKVEGNKDDPRDFVLWKAQNYTYEPAWKSPWGMGRPGWHIEDTAISEKYLGSQYDIHCGGLDLKFPHHEAEIAQQESASGKKPFVKYWIHSGLLTNNGEKMSKSLGNFVTIGEALKKYPVEVWRFFMLNAHYRSPIDYTDDNIKQAQATLNRLVEFKTKLELVRGGKSNPEVVEKFSKTKEGFKANMTDDFNTPKAFAALFEFIREMNPLIDQNKLGQENAKDILDFLKNIDTFLKIIPGKEEIPQEIRQMAEARDKARREKDFDKSDQLREEIEEKGYTIKDTPSGPRVYKK
jgi:cysteinyl-tRNA synthetase